MNSLKLLQIMLEETEQKIYNSYLRAQAEHHKRPYQLRKDFSKMRQKDVLQLKRLRLFFEQYRDVNPFHFFKAGFKYQTNVYPTLEYFNTLKAARVYSKYIKQKYYQDVDNIESLKDFKDGILFIYGFLQEKDISLLDYKTCVNENGVPWCVIHLKQQNISFYHLHCLQIDDQMFPVDYRNLITDDFEKVWENTKQDYLKSKKMKQIGIRFNKFSHRLIKAGKRTQLK